MTARSECTRCVMDSSAVDIHFDNEGICSYCTEFLASVEKEIPDAFIRKNRLDSLVSAIKTAGSSKPYDCIVGVSGGVDSSYTLVRAVELGLRPLALHLDNGWNSSLAVRNIGNLVTTLGVDLHTHVIDWDENRRLQRAFFDAGVVDIELLMDNAMLAANYSAARRFGVRYLLTGGNFITEGLRMPPGWNHFKMDARNIHGINKQFGTCSIDTHPLMSSWKFVRDQYIFRIRWIGLPQYFEFSKATALSELEEKVGYQSYPYKHYESIFTRFYQGYILPTKFGIDKRRVHLSALVATGEMTRLHAQEILTQSPYPDARVLADDLDYVRKKLGYSEAEFSAYINASIHPHSTYPSEEWVFNLLVSVRKHFGGLARLVAPSQ